MPVADLVDDGTIVEWASLSEFTTYKFGGPARYLAEVADAPALGRIADLLATSPALDVVVIGRGSNLVVSDRGFDGLAIRLVGDYLRIDVVDALVVAGGAAPLPRLAREAARAGRGGLEFYVGIPGSVGGAVCMNAGCHGTETADVLVDAEILDLRLGTLQTRSPADLGLRYRHSDLEPGQVVTRARFSTIDRDPDEGERMLREITQWRRDNQPGGTFNAGSVFKNPPGDHAGRIIDDLGLKGLQVGGAAVSERHANFFVAEPGTAAQDIYDLVAEVRRRVKDAVGVDLVPEIVFVGDFSS